MAIFLFLQKISRKRWVVRSMNLYRTWFIFDEQTITFLHIHESTNCTGYIWPLWYISVGINCIILVQLVMHIIAGHSQNQAWNMVQSLSWCCENSSWWIVALTSIDPGIFKFDDGVYTCYGVRMLFQRGKECRLKTTIWNWSNTI